MLKRCWKVAEKVLERCRGCLEVEVCRGAEVLRCRGEEEVQRRCRGAEEVHSCRCAGIQKSRSAEVLKEVLRRRC